MLLFSKRLYYFYLIFNYRYQTRKLIIERLKKDGSTEGGKDGMDACFISLNSEKTKTQLSHLLKSL